MYDKYGINSEEQKFISTMVRPLKTMQTNLEKKLFQPKNERKLRIYAWSTLEIKKFKGCLKVGQTTRDVNKRIKESQGCQVEYTLEINEEAYTEKGILFTDIDVRRRLLKKVLKMYQVNGCFAQKKMFC